MLTPRSHMFQAVSDMNVAFGNPVGLSAHLLLPKEHPVFVQCMELLKKQVQNIPEEYKELTAAINTGDVDKIRDGLCDIMVFCLGAFHRLGLDADDDMRAVVEGVMTRFCHTEADITATAAKWAALGVNDLVAAGKFPRAYVKAASDQTSTEGEFIPKGKFLKSVNTREPVLTPIQPVQPDLFSTPPGIPATLAAPAAERVSQPAAPAVPARKFFGATESGRSSSNEPIASPPPPRADKPVEQWGWPLGEKDLNPVDAMAAERAMYRDHAVDWQTVRNAMHHSLNTLLDGMSHTERAKVLSGVTPLEITIVHRVP